MSSSFSPTGTTTNLTRLEMEQLRRADAFADGKGLTIGDSGLAPEGVVGVGSVNAEPYFTGPQASVDDLLSALVPDKPGEGVGHTTFFPTTPTLGGGSTPTATAGPTWYGPTQIGFGTTGFALSTTEWSDTAGQFTLAGPGYNVQVGDYVLVNKKVTPGTDLNDSCVATVTNVAATILDVGSIWNPTNVGSETLLDPTAGDTFSYSIIRRGAVQLFAVPGSGPVGQEQTFLFVKPASTLHSDLNPSLSDINADRLTNVVSPRRSGVGADRSDSVFESPAPRTGLDLLGYRVIFYPDDGTGNPDFTSPIASLNPTIDPAIPASDQRITIDYTAGIVRLSCAPALGGDIKVSGGTDPTSGRLNLYATFFAYQSSASTGSAKGLYSTRSTTDTTQSPGRVVYDNAASTWVIHNPLSVRVGGTGSGAQLRTMDVVNSTSLVARANAMGVSVGDGVTSFGDFNGVDAIEQAVTFWGTAGTSSLRVHVKRGTYTIEALTVPTLQELILEGDGRQDTRITLAPTGLTAMTVTSGGQLVLKDLALVQTTGGPVQVGGSIRVERCLFEGVQTQYIMGSSFRAATSGNRSATAIVRDSEFNHSGRTSSCIEFGNSLGTKSGVEYEDCTFESAATGEPLISVNVISSGDPGLFSHVLFNRCNILLHGIASASSTALSGPTGLVNLDPSLGVHNDLGIDEWSFKDCNVSVADEAIDNKILLHLLPVAWNAANVTVRMRVGKFSISGGTWSVPGTQGSDFAPFWLQANYPVVEGTTFLGCGTAFGALGVAPEYRGNGFWTNAMKVALNDAVGTPASTSAHTAFSIVASGSGLINAQGGLTIRNVRFSRFHRSSGSGELFLQGPDLSQPAVNVDGITIDSFNFGVAETDVPFSRLTIRPGGVGTTNRGTQGVFRNIHFNLQPSSVSLDWVMNCIINLSTEGDLDCDRVFVDGWVNPTANSFQQGRTGIDIQNVWGVNTSVRGRVSLKNSRVWGMGRGIRVSTNPASYTLQNNEVYVNGDGTNDLTRAFDINVDTHPAYASRVESCTAVMNNLPAASTAVGYRLNTSRWEYFAPVFVVNNNIYMSTAENDITSDNVGIAVLSNHASSNINLTLHGNSGYYNGAAFQGFLKGKMQRRTALGLDPGTRGGGVGASYVGAETGHDATISSLYFYITTEIMVHNNLYLETP